MGLKMTNSKIMGVHWKIQFLGGQVHKKTIDRGSCLKRGMTGQFKDLRGVYKKEGVVFLRGGGIDSLMHTMSY